MKAYTYIDKGHFELQDKPKPTLQDPKDAIVKVTLASICSSDLHIKHGSVPRAVPGITVGHEMVGIVEQVGPEVKSVAPGDRVTVNVETFCGERLLHLIARDEFQVFHGFEGNFLIVVVDSLEIPVFSHFQVNRYVSKSFSVDVAKGELC